jgi:hypothetical protein
MLRTADNPLTSYLNPVTGQSLPEVPSEVDQNEKQHSQGGRLSQYHVGFDPANHGSFYHPRTRSSCIQFNRTPARAFHLIAKDLTKDWPSPLIGTDGKNTGVEFRNAEDAAAAHLAQLKDSRTSAMRSREPRADVTEQVDERERYSYITKNAMSEAHVAVLDHTVQEKPTSGSSPLSGSFT